MGLRALALFLLLAVAGCGTEYGDTKMASEPIPPGKAEVIFFRKTSYVLAGAYTRVRINDLLVGSLANGSLLRTYPAAGANKVSITKHEIFTERPVGDANLVFQEGHSYFIEVGVQPGCGDFNAGQCILAALANSIKPTDMTDQNVVCGMGFCMVPRTEAFSRPLLSRLTVETPINN